MPHNYEISQMSKSFPFVVDAKVDILHKDMNKIMEKLDVILNRHHGNQVRTKILLSRSFKGFYATVEISSTRLS